MYLFDQRELRAVFDGDEAREMERKKSYIMQRDILDGANARTFVYVIN